MHEILYIKVDVIDASWLDDLDVESLFPEHYSPSLIDSDEGKAVDVSFPGGKSRFIFYGHEIECHFEYYDEDEDFDNEWEEFKEYSDDIGISLVEYVAEQISNRTGLSTSYT